MDKLKTYIWTIKKEEKLTGIFLLVAAESSSINIALCNVAEARFNCVQKQSVIRRILEILSLKVYSNMKLNRTTAGKTQCYCPNNGRGSSAG
jgi:hypothetical protein